MNAQYTDTQLKQALAKMLPDVITELSPIENTMEDYPILIWYGNNTYIENTELLHLCHLVEEELLNTFTNGRWTWYVGEIKMGAYYGAGIHATWQQRVIALCRVKGVVIV